MEIQDLKVENTKGFYSVSVYADEVVFKSSRWEDDKVVTGWKARAIQVVVLVVLLAFMSMLCSLPALAMQGLISLLGG